jgi:hypothetical protein
VSSGALPGRAADMEFCGRERVGSGWGAGGVRMGCGWGADGVRMGCGWGAGSGTPCSEGCVHALIRRLPVLAAAFGCTSGSGRWSGGGWWLRWLRWPYASPRWPHVERVGASVAGVGGRRGRMRGPCVPGYQSARRGFDCEAFTLAVPRPRLSEGGRGMWEQRPRSEGGSRKARYQGADPITPWRSESKVVPSDASTER